MIRLAYKIVSFCWILSPIAFLAGRFLGIYNFSYDVAIFAGLMVMSGLAAFLNVEDR